MPTTIEPMEARRRTVSKPLTIFGELGNISVSTKRNIEPPIMSQPAFIREMIIAHWSWGGGRCGENLLNLPPGPSCLRHYGQRFMKTHRRQMDYPHRR